MGGAYMCIYPMDSPGGYQLIGRTLPMWCTFAQWGQKDIYSRDKPWFLEMFDQIRFYKVPETAEEAKATGATECLDDLRAKFKAGLFTPRMEEEWLDLGKAKQQYHSPEVEAYKRKQAVAVDEQNEEERLSMLRLSSATATAQKNDEEIRKWKRLIYGTHMVNNKVDEWVSNGQDNHKSGRRKIKRPSRKSFSSGNSDCVSASYMKDDWLHSPNGHTRNYRR